MDFTALGRYTEASERAACLVRSRNGVLANVARQLNVAIGSKSGGHIGVAVDFSNLVKQLGDAESLDAELAQAIAEANAASVDCDRRPLKIWPMVIR